MSIILPNNVRGRSENKPTHTAPGNTLWLSERDGAGDPKPTLWAQMDASGTNWVDVATLGGGGDAAAGGATRFIANFQRKMAAMAVCRTRYIVDFEQEVPSY